MLLITSWIDVFWKYCKIRKIISQIFFKVYSGNIMFMRNLAPGIGRYSLSKIASIHVTLRCFVFFSWSRNYGINHWGSFTNYIYKRRWVGGQSQKSPIFVNNYKVELVNAGRWSKKPKYCQRSLWTTPRGETRESFSTFATKYKQGGSRALMTH